MRRSARSGTMRRRLAAVCAVAALAASAGCTSGSKDAGLGYAPGDGTVVTVDAADRRAPIEAEGTTLDGDPISLADYRGTIVVLNVWGQWCAECHAEQAGLVDAANKTKNAAFIGIDNRDDSISSARDYVAQYDVPYPSFYDPDGTILLAFHDALPPTAVPATLVLDPDGRIAALVSGPVTANTVQKLVADVAAEKS